MLPQTLQFAPGGLGPALDAPSIGASTGGLLHHQRLSSVLRGIVEGLEASAAEMFLLDDATAELRSAADFGDAPGAGPRLLEQARADVVAMAGEAVVLEDEETVADWPVPRRCRAAVCVPVASDTTIHGTLWLYSNKPREFSDRQLQLIEIAAGRLAVELERRRLIDASEQLRPVVSARLPEPTPAEFGELEVGGWSEPSTPGFHDWIRLPGDRLLLSAAAVVDTPGGSRDDALAAAQAARIAARCHAETAANAGELMTRVARTVWQATPGGEGLSIALALVDAEECSGTYALAGGAAAMSIRASRTYIESTEDPPAGWDTEGEYPACGFELKLRERLVFSVVDPRFATPYRLDKLANSYRGLPAETHRQMTADAAADALRSQADAPLAAVALRWK